MARAPSFGGKTRLAPHLSAARLTSLRTALLADSLFALGGLPGLTVFFTPDEAEQEIASLCGAAVPRVAQGAGDLGARMVGALQHLLRGGRCDAAILVGSDIPLLTRDQVAEAAELLLPLRSAKASAERRIVLGPADDGGYYLIGMTHLHASLFEGIAWGSDSVLTDTLRAADRAAIDTHLTRSAYDVDTIDDLLRLERDLGWLPSSVCPALRRWFSEG
jgi:rSAM/selenodomain-associated transferase 1